jgi:Ring finger domain
MTWNSPCDKPLRWWVLVFTGRHLLLLPLELSRYNSIRNDDAASLMSLKRTINHINFAMMIWFIIGQVWLYSSDSCNKTLWVYALVLSIMVYVLITAPILLVLAFLICLPCVFCVMRLLATEPGAPQDVIQNLPVHTFSRTTDEEASDDRQTCSICQNDYEFGDELRELPCKHQFHVACIDQWLPIKRTCPLCRMDITGDNSADNQV